MSDKQLAHGRHPNTITFGAERVLVANNYSENGTGLQLIPAMRVKETHVGQLAKSMEEASVARAVCRIELPTG